jgi:hypothetical protein
VRRAEWEWAIKRLVADRGWELRGDILLEPAGGLKVRVHVPTDPPRAWRQFYVPEAAFLSAPAWDDVVDRVNLELDAIEKKLQQEAAPTPWSPYPWSPHP